MRRWAHECGQWRRWAGGHKAQPCLGHRDPAVRHYSHAVALHDKDIPDDLVASR